MTDGQKQPEFTPDYIDQLFSGTNSKPQPEKAPEPAPPAEKKAQIFTAAKAVAMQETDTEEYAPAPQKSWRKPLLILAAAAVLILMLCLILPNVIANAQSDRWQKRCEEAYAELISEQRPFLIVVQRYHESEKASEESTVTHWQDGNDYLTIESSEEKTTHLLAKDNRIFKKTVTPDNPNGRWMPVDVLLSPELNTSNTFSNLDNALPSIRATLLRVDVTFTQVNTSGVTRTICFHFNPFGKLLGINTAIARDAVSMQQNMTVLSTNPEKIKSAIQKAYEEATGKK